MKLLPCSVRDVISEEEDRTLGGVALVKSSSLGVVWTLTRAGEQASSAAQKVMIQLATSLTTKLALTLMRSHWHFAMKSGSVIEKQLKTSNFHADFLSAQTKSVTSWTLPDLDLHWSIAHWVVRRIWWMNITPAVAGSEKFISAVSIATLCSVSRRLSALWALEMATRRISPETGHFD
jgi:hypothetical protein